MTPLERAMKYADAVPSAVSGNGGHNQTFALACALYNGFALTEAETLAVLKIYNFKCQPPWSEAELNHKVRSAAGTRHDRPRGHLLYPGDRRDGSVSKPAPKIRIDPATAIEKILKGFRATEVDLWEASPIRPPDNFHLDAICLLETVFQPGEHINVVTDYVLRDGKKAHPKGEGVTRERDDWIQHWYQKGMPVSDAGGWMRINPVKGGITDQHVTSFRHTLLEFDRIPLDLQISIICRLPIPISCVLTSGGKSIHAWARIDATDLETYQSTVLRLRDCVVPFGVDAANKNPSRLSRLVGVTRVIGATGDGQQRLLYLNRNPQAKFILP